MNVYQVPHQSCNCYLLLTDCTIKHVKGGGRWGVGGGGGWGGGGAGGRLNGHLKMINSHLP